MTSETPTNSYTAEASLRDCPNGKRIDYIMCSSRKDLRIETVDVNIPLPTRVPHRLHSYSDHEAVCAKFRIVSALESASTANEKENKEPCIESLKEALQVCDTALKTLSYDKRKYWLLFGVVIVLLAALPFSHDGSLLVHYVLTISELFLTLFAVFSLIMGTIWNRIERHSILAGKLGITTRLQSLDTNC